MMTDRSSTGRAVQRRTLIQGAGAVGGAVVGASVLAACGDDGTSTGSSPTTQASGTTGGESASGGNGGGASTGTELGPVSDVPVGGGRLFESEKVLVVQPNEGEFVGYSSVCTHQGCVVSLVEDGVMICPCHGSEFALVDGSVEEGPATEALAKKDVQVDGDTIYLV